MMISSASCHANDNNNKPSTTCTFTGINTQSSSSPRSQLASSHLPLSSASGPSPGSPTTSALSMKRLLAKPALPSACTHGHNRGSGNESEGFSNGSQRKIHVDLGAVPPKVERSRSLQSLLDHRKEMSVNATAPEKDKGKHKEKRPRNVLRRRPSTSAQANSSSVSPLKSPLPPLTPRSPLTPSMFSPSSPASSTSFPLGSTPCSTTTPSSSPQTRVYPARSTSSFDKPPLPPRPPNEENIQDRPSGSGLAQTCHEQRRNKVQAVVEECVVNVTDEKGKRVDPRARLRELKGHPCPSLSSSSPSKSHPSSPRFYQHPHHLSAASLNGRSSSRSRSRSRNTQRIDSESSSTSLTPAAAVIATYKRQELQYETSVFGRSSIDVCTGEFGELGPRKKMKKRPHTSSGHGRSATEIRPQVPVPGSRFDNVEVDDKHQPYYTVFGTSSDRVVAAGGPEDRPCLSWEMVPPFMLAHKGSLGDGDGGDSGGGLRTLTRKVSGHFKRAGNAMQNEGEEKRRVSLSAERERGRASFQEKSRTRALPGKGDKGGLSLRLSIDKFPEIKASRAEKEKMEKGTTPTSATKSTGSGPSTSSPSNNNGNKLWKLMKRISTGGLREKFLHGEAPPPVPSLPKEYTGMDPIIPWEAVKRETSSALPLAEGLGQAVRKKASIILGVKMTSSATQVPIPVVGPSPHVPRLSTTTRSSSPVSSDVASSRFFACCKPSSFSAHSSTSSLLIEDSTYVPPLPRSSFSNKGGVGQHIVPPSELGKMHIHSKTGDGYEGSEPLSSLSSSRNPTTPSPRSHMKLRVVVPSTPSSMVETLRKHDHYNISHPPAPDMVSLPLPPRRPGVPLGRMRRDMYASITPEAGWGNQQAQNGNNMAGNKEMTEWERIWGGNSLKMDLEDADEKTLDSHSGSPLIPSFSTDEPINTFPSKYASTKTSRRLDSKPCPSTTPSIICLPPLRLHMDVMCDVDGPVKPMSPPPRPARNPQRSASSPAKPSQIES